MKLIKYKVFCATDNKWEEFYLEESKNPGLVCPVSPAHLAQGGSLFPTGEYSDLRAIGPDGSQIVAPTFEYDNDLNGVWKGYGYQAAAGVLNIYDEPITTELKLRGGWYELVAPTATPQATKLDYLEFSIVDKDNVLGLFANYGLTPGVDVLELKKFVRTDYINPYKNERQTFHSQGASSVMAGLFFRTHYRSFGSTPVDFKVVLNYHEP